MFFFHSFHYSFCFSLKIYTLFYFPIRFLPHYDSLCSSFKSVLDNYLCKSGKESSLKIDTYIVFYEEQDDRPRVVGAATNSGAGAPDCNEIQRGFHGADQSGGSGLDFIVVIAVVI